MNKYNRPLITMMVGIAIIVTGFNMSLARTSWSESITTSGNKGRNAAIGAGVGAVGGGLLAAFVGGVGIVAAGTGVGLPAGAGLIALAGTLGAGAGGVAGAATGVSGSSHAISHSNPIYATWLWGIILAIGFFVLYNSFGQLKNVIRMK